MMYIVWRTAGGTKNFIIENDEARSSITITKSRWHDGIKKFDTFNDALKFITNMWANRWGDKYLSIGDLDGNKIFTLRPYKSIEKYEYRILNALWKGQKLTDKHLNVILDKYKFFPQTYNDGERERMANILYNKYKK